jgi:hypothetical protein
MGTGAEAGGSVRKLRFGVRRFSAALGEGVVRLNGYLRVGGGRSYTPVAFRVWGATRMTMNDPAEWWVCRARRVARKVNLGWWLERFLPSLAALSVAGAVALLVVRRYGEDPGLLWVALGVGVVFAAVASRLVRPERAFGERDGLVRLESLHRLKSRLTAAADGVGDWPPVQPGVSDGYAWRRQRIVIPPLLSLAVLSAAAWAPISPTAEESRRALEEPLAWRQVEEWANTLEEQAFLDPEPLQELRERVQQLRDRPMEEWYSHSSLEASDSLREETERAIEELARDLHSVAAGVAAVETFPDALPASVADAWKEFMTQSLEGLTHGALPIDPALLAQLEGIDPASLRRLTAEEWEALKLALEQGLGACSACNGTGTNLVVGASMRWSPQGSPTRGPGEAPMYLKPEQTRLEEGAMEALRNPSLDRAALGETLAIRQTEHEVDESLYGGPQAAGAVDATGAGGEAIWKTPLTPEEQAVLQRYYDE